MPTKKNYETSLIKIDPIIYTIEPFLYSRVCILLYFGGAKIIVSKEQSNTYISFSHFYISFPPKGLICYLILI